MPVWDILGFGAVAVDDLLLVDSYPAPDSKMPVRGKQREGGGLAGTALVAAAAWAHERPMPASWTTMSYRASLLKDSATRGG